MRAVLPAALAAVVVLPLASAVADDAIDAPTRTAIFALATRGYAMPGKAEMRNVRKSRARNGMGYCGEVTIESGAGFTVFHAILGQGADASVLRVADYPPDEGNNFAENVVRLMHNFGCME